MAASQDQPVAPWPAPAPGRRRVVIVGAGFGGLNVAKGLADAPGLEVVLFDRRNHHLFQPLLYQVATAALSPADIAVPIREELSRHRNIEVHLGAVEHIDLAGRVVRAGAIACPYDTLVLACGARHSYFGHPDWEAWAPGLKTLEQATEIRYRVLSAFEQAENMPDEAARGPYLCFVVVGGGPTGVELAGALAEIARGVLARDFRRFDARRTRVVLVEAGPRILSMFDSEHSERACQDLTELGVEVMTQARVVGVDAEGVQLESGRIAARTVLWAAGVQPSGLNPLLGVPLDRSGRVIVEADLSLKDWPEVFVIGDQAHARDAAGNPLPGLAPVAIQQGQAVAVNIRRDRHGEPRHPFHYRDKGMMATIGKRRAIAISGRLRLSGFLAWLAWLFIHVLYLVGFRNRIAVIASWAWSYLFGRRSARLIVGKRWRFYGPEGET